MNNDPFITGPESTKRFGDVLPVQDHYFVLYDGEGYARHGIPSGPVGLLVFPTLEKAEAFYESVGVGIPQFKPTSVSAESFHRLCKEAGGFCVAEGLMVGVCSSVTVKDLFEMNLDDCE